MQLFGKEVGKEPIIVAEIGVNHEGAFDKALQLIELAAKAGADAVKFQSYTPDRYQSVDDMERFQRITRFALDLEQHQIMAATAKKFGVALFSTPLTEDWIDHLIEFGPVLKIASGDMTFEPLVRRAAASGATLIVSTGNATEAEVDQMVDWVKSERPDDDLANCLLLMHCIAAYPTPADQANISSIPYMKQRYGVSVGWSNHVIGSDACYGALAIGADAIEVHFTDQKSGRDFRDHELSFDADDLASLVQRAPTYFAMGGQSGIFRHECELPVNSMRKGLVAASDIDAGTVLTEDLVMYARPATYFGSGDLDSVLGKTLIVGLKKGQLLQPDQF